jgi:hypothetical protein
MLKHQGLYERDAFSEIAYPTNRVARAQFNLHRS